MELSFIYYRHCSLCITTYIIYLPITKYQELQMIQICLQECKLPLLIKYQFYTILCFFHKHRIGWSLWNLLSVNILLNLLLFFRELLEQVAEFEKAEFTSSNKKVILIISKSLLIFACMVMCQCAYLLVCIWLHMCTAACAYVCACIWRPDVDEVFSLVTFYFYWGRNFY